MGGGKGGGGRGGKERWVGVVLGVVIVMVLDGFSLEGELVFLWFCWLVGWGCRCLRLWIVVVVMMRKGNFCSLIWRPFTAWHRRRLSDRLV